MTKRTRKGKVGEAGLAYAVGDVSAMAESTVTTISSKHQITLPAALVRQLGLQPGDKLTVRLEDHRITLERRPRTPDEWVQRFSGALADRPYWGTKEEIDEYVRKERESWRERDERLTS